MKRLLRGIGVVLQSIPIPFIIVLSWLDTKMPESKLWDVTLQVCAAPLIPFLWVGDKFLAWGMENR